MLSVVRISGKGRGVIASRDIAEGEIIERASILRVDAALLTEPKPGNLDSYLFRWTGGAFVLALGSGSLINHSADPNTQFVKFPEEEVIEFRALRGISAGEEVLIDYCQGNPAGRADLWFTPL